MKNGIGRAKVLVVAGCTNSGKTTVASHLEKRLSEGGKSVEIIHQDDFYMVKEKVNKIWREEGSNPPFYYDYDSPSAVDVDSFLKKFKDVCPFDLLNIKQIREEKDFVIIEGNMITEFEKILAISDQILFLTMDLKTCTRRRLTRNYDPPDEEGYFERIVWPAYQQHLKKAFEMARNDKRITFLDVSGESDDPHEENVNTIINSFTDDIVRICFSPLSAEETTRLVTSPSCGAISVFLGTTRNTFDGRKVVRLEYESYDEMAYKELRKLCSQLRRRFQTLENIVIIHRIGEVPVGEASVIIATASPHRKEAIDATEWAIDELKRTVPIWKKEVYEDGGCSWKENAECCDHKHKEISLDTKKLEESKRNRAMNRKIFWLD